MTNRRTPLSIASHGRSRTGRSAAVGAAALLVAACSGSDGDTDDGAAEPVPAEADADGGDATGADTAELADDSDAGDGGAGGGLGPDDVGTGVLRIDGVDFADMRGDCEISRSFGSEDVGDVSAPGKSVIVGVDNVEAAGDDAVNFIMINETSFRVRNTDQGTIDTIDEIGVRTSNGSIDYATVVFAGTLEDGQSVVAELVCELQNQF